MDSWSGFWKGCWNSLESQVFSFWCFFFFFWWGVLVFSSFIFFVWFGRVYFSCLRRGISGQQHCIYISIYIYTPLSCMDRTANHLSGLFALCSARGGVLPSFFLSLFLPLFLWQRFFLSCRYGEFIPGLFSLVWRAWSITRLILYVGSFPRLSES